MVSLIACIPLFHPGFFPMHDNEQIGRLFALDNALKAGQFPVRIIQDLGFGYGYLLFNFYPPLVYYFGEIFKILSFSYIDSMKIVMGGGFIFAALSMYLFSKELFGKIPGFVASAFYTFAPYHALDLYVRGAVPEFFSFVFVPAIFYSYLKLSKENSRKYVVMAAFFNFLLLITHNLVALMAAAFIGAYVIFLLYESKKRKTFIKNVLLSAVFSFLLSSFFIIPALLENKYTMVSLLTKELADYSNHFVYIRQFWNSMWGYGGSLYGLEDGLSFQMGKLHIVLSGAALIIFVYEALRKRFIPQVCLFIILFLISAFMQTFYSKFIWDLLAPLSYIQFPWRYLLFSAFFSSVLAGFVVSYIAEAKVAVYFSIGLVLLVIGLNIGYFRPEKYLTVNDLRFINRDTLRWETSVMAFEYVPNGISMKKSAVGNSVVNINKDGVSKSVFKVSSGNMSVRVLDDLPQEKKLEVIVTEGGKLTLNEFAYPGWKVLVNGKAVDFKSNNSLKLISIDLNIGNYVVDARFQDTNIRRVANVLSALGIFLLVIYSYPILIKKYAKS